MARQRDRIYMPMGTGGLMRFSEEEKVLIKVKPRQVVYLIAGIVALELVLKIIFALY
jgi:preprotein translocase subunit Sec61beta